MTEYSYDSKSLIRDGKRWFPVMGEIHYSRYPEQYWKEALLKMKEGGVDIVSSYVIWIHHEEIENEWDWTGCRNLRKFVELIKECGLTMVLRIGPWSHAEVRHGGFPDWLLAKVPDARSTNDESYFAEVEKFYAETYAQVDGLLLKDGGPIIGVQIDNEFGHCGGLSGEDGEFHMKHLTEIAKKVGFDVPLYTATGWGGAITAGLLPVMGGYCEAPWDPRITEIEPSGNYIFTYERNDHAIGCDFGIGEGITFDMTKFPYLTAELGGGLQVTLKRRPVARPKDIGGMSIAKIGSGCNLLGYYMYHGGANPDGKLTTLEENIATGSLNDMNVVNYDFRAPLGQYGQPNGTYDEIRLFAAFVHDFGEQLCATDTVFGDENPLKPENRSDLRTSWRDSEGSGWVFVNNFQRRQVQDCHKAVCLSRNSVSFPKIDICDGDFFFLPYNMKVGKSTLTTALVTPLMKTSAFTAFYSAVAPEGKSKAVVSKVQKASEADGDFYQFENAGDDVVVTLTREDALKSHKAGDSIIVTDAVFYQDGGKLVFESDRNFTVKAYPELKELPEGLEKTGSENGFTVYQYKKALPAKPEVVFEKISEKDGTASYKVTVSEWTGHDAFMTVAYTGNCARLYENGKLIDDGIYVGEEFPWNIGLRKFGNGKHEFLLEIDELRKDAPVFIEKWPEIKGESVAELKSVTSSVMVSVR